MLCFHSTFFHLFNLFNFRISVITCAFSLAFIIVYKRLPITLETLDFHFGKHSITKKFL